MEDMELYRRLAALERRVNKLDRKSNGGRPPGWIGEAFHLLAEHFVIDIS